MTQAVIVLPPPSYGKQETKFLALHTYMYPTDMHIPDRTLPNHTRKCRFSGDGPADVTHRTTQGLGRAERVSPITSLAHRIFTNKSQLGGVRGGLCCSFSWCKDATQSHKSRESASSCHSARLNCLNFGDPEFC